MEPVSTEAGEQEAQFRVVDDPQRVELLTRQLRNESAEFALRLFSLAQSISQSDFPYYIAIVEGGNHASQGFRLQMANGEIRDLELAPYIKLDSAAKSFGTTLLHETGHMIFSLLSDGRGIPTQQIAPMFHTTAAITDRGTAFNEGFAEHLEAIVAHLTEDQQLLDFYQHRRLADDKGSSVRSGFLFPVDDLSNYAQSFARYRSVRDNHYSFENASTAHDYNRIQLSPMPDLERLRNPSQLIASEGFCASYFFWLVAEQLQDLSDEQATIAYTPVFEALRAVLTQPGLEQSSPVPPYLAEFVKRFGQDETALRRQGLRLLYHLSHGAFFDSDYAARWQAVVDASFQLDVTQLRELHAAIAAGEEGAIERCMANIDFIDQAIGPVVAAMAKGTSVQLPLALGGQEIPLTFDINTVPTRILALLPGITAEEVDSFAASREEEPFKNLADVFARAGLRPETTASIEELDLTQ